MGRARPGVRSCITRGSNIDPRGKKFLLGDKKILAVIMFYDPPRGHSTLTICNISMVLTFRVGGGGEDI